MISMIFILSGFIVGPFLMLATRKGCRFRAEAIGGRPTNRLQDYLLGVVLFAGTVPIALYAGTCSHFSTAAGVVMYGLALLAWACWVFWLREQVALRRRWRTTWLIGMLVAGFAGIVVGVAAPVLIPSWVSYLNAKGNPPADIGEMVKIPGGSFMMGCVPGDSNCSDDERPRHRVTLDSFYMDKYEVTQGEYERVMGKNPSSHQDCGSNCPVENVSWNDAQSYCKKVSKRLPTEAEWEYAARGGLEGKKYPWGDEEATCSRAIMGDPLILVINGCGINGTWPVGSKPKGKNGYGLYDMSGNVWEWCSDWYGKDYYSSRPANNPTGPSSGSARVLRGGSWYSRTRSLRASNRYDYAPTSRYGDGGFRCVRDK